MIQNKATVKIHDDSGERKPRRVTVESYCFDRKKVYIDIGKEVPAIVFGDDLIQAIKNCMAIGR